MRIISLTLIGCRRLSLRNIHTFVITPKDIIQIILGTNGSGKSSVLNELSPMPADKNDFSKTGKKIFQCEKRNSIYTLTSTFGPTKHSFVKDGEELNQGGTEKVQRDLVMDHFGMDNAIHDLVRGSEKFCTMAPAKRREWLTRLSVADYDFAMDAYDKIRKRHSEVSGAGKRNSANLVIETAKIISSDEEERLATEVGELHRELLILKEQRLPLERSPTDAANRRDQVLRELSNLSSRLLSSKIIAPLRYAEGSSVDLRDEWGEPVRTRYKAMEEVDAGINELRHRIVVAETTINHTTELFNKHQRNYDILLKAGQDGIQNLTKQFEGLEIERRALLQRRKLELDITDPEAAHRAYESILQDLQVLLENMPVNADRRLGRERMRVLQEERFALEERMNFARQEIAKLQAHIDHADHHRGKGSIECPKCSHSWVAGINEVQYAHAKEKVKTLHENTDADKKQLAKLLDEIKEIDHYFGQYREFMSYVKNVTILEPFWVHLMEGKFVTDFPKEAINQTRIFQRDLEHTVQSQRILAKMDEIAKLRLAAEQVGDTSIQEVKSEMDSLSTKLGMLTAQLSQLQRSVSDYTEYRRQLTIGFQLGEQIKQLYAQAEMFQDSYVEALRRETILHCIYQVENALGVKEEALRNAQMQKAIVGKLQEHVNQLALEEDALAHMIRALSPKNGLIAEGLLGFIRSFVGQMNSFIKKVWTYPLQVVPTGYNSEDNEQSAELDYKFKLISGDHNNLVPDASKGSDGQIEIINLAFKITAIHYLHLSDMPLFLDEFGKTLDDAHREAATATIKSLMENYNYSQCFLVSHYASSYGAFNNAEICVLDKSNLALASTMVYNKHVTIK